MSIFDPFNDDEVSAPVAPAGPAEPVSLPCVPVTPTKPNRGVGGGGESNSTPLKTATSLKKSSNIISPIKLSVEKANNSVAPKSANKMELSTIKAGADISEARDRINNILQKESAMLEAGVTRRRTYEVISRLLSAKKMMMSATDKSGNIRDEEVDDLDKQRQGAEMALKVLGDMIERKEITETREVKVEIDAGRMERVMERMEEINRKMLASRDSAPERVGVVEAVMVEAV